MLLAVITGKNLIMKEQKPNQLFLFKKVKNADPTKNDTFNLFKRILLKDNPKIGKISMQFYFRNIKGREPFEIVFAKQDSIITLNFETDEVKTLCKYTAPLLKQPEFFTVNEDQSVGIIMGDNDGILYYFN